MTAERLGDCEKCPLNERPVVPGYGPKGGLVVVGEAPGQNEARRGRPFVGDAGEVLRQVLKACGQDPDEVYYTNAVVRHPVGNKTPGMIPIRACNDRLHDELADVTPTKILSVGGVALTALTRAKRVLPITKERGLAQWVEVGGKQVLYVPSIHPALVLRDPDMFPDLVFDVQKLLRIEAPHPEIPVDTYVAESWDDLEGRLQELASATVISCDLETYGFNPIYKPLLSIGFGAADDVGGASVIVPEELIAEKRVNDLVWEFITEVPSRFVFHNAKFDLQFLRHYHGRWYPDDVLMGDTMLLHYLHDERPIGRYLGHSLKDIARTWYDVPDYHWDFEAFYATPKEERDYAGLYRYQGQDCVYTARLAFDIPTRLEEEMDEDGSEWFDPLGVHDRILMPGARAFAQAEYHGTYIDQPFFQTMGADLEAKSEASRKALEVVAGEGFNPGSPAQVKAFIQTLGTITKLAVHRGYMRQTDDVTTDRETLEAMIRLWGKDDDRSKILQHIIDYRNAQKTLQTNVNGLLSRIDPDGRIRPSFQLAGTATGRLSCSNPNFQNIPAYSEYNVRAAFAAPDPDHLFVEVDYSQLELRVAAWLSQDPDLIDVFRSGKDIHSEVAVAMFHKPAEEITSGERYMAKRVDFGILYGRSAKALAEGPEMDYLVDRLGGERWSLEQAEVYVRRFLDGFPRLRDWMEEVAKGAVRDHYVDTPLGRRRRFPYITKSNVGHTRRQAVNTPIQGVASDLCLEALVRISKRTHEFGGQVLFAVHDSVALEVPVRSIAKAVEILRYEFEENLSIDPMGIPFPSDIEVGRNWGNLTKYDDPTDKGKVGAAITLEPRSSRARPPAKRGGRSAIGGRHR